MVRELTQDEFVELLDRWAGRHVAVRVVAEPDELLAVFSGELESRTEARHPAMFWPVQAGQLGHGFETPGIYLHPSLFTGAAVHPDRGVLELRQGGATLNLRRLA